MPFKSLTFSVLIASPSDLTDERKAARVTIQDWNDLHAVAEGVTLLPVMWETHATPEAGDRPQEIINRQLVANADLLIGLFWTKMGTGTGVAESGTVEEIDQIVGAGKPAMLYFSQRPVDPGTLDLDQIARLKAFKEETYKSALAGQFRSPEELRQTLLRDLTRRVRMIKHDADEQAQAEEAARGVDTAEEAGRQQAKDKWDQFTKSLLDGSYRGLPKGPYLSVAIVPLRPLTTPLDLYLVNKKDGVNLRPIGTNGWNTDLFGRALVNHNGSKARGNRPAEPPTTAVELQHDGTIFAATDIYVRHPEDGGRAVAMEREEYQLFSYAAQYVALQRKLGVVGPLEARVMLNGVKGAELHPGRPILWDSQSFRSLTDDIYVIGPVTLDASVDGICVALIAEAMRMGFNVLWRDAGLPFDPCFTTDGKYKTS